MEKEEKERMEQAREAEAPLFKNICDCEYEPATTSANTVMSQRWDWYGESPARWWEEASSDTREIAFLAVVSLLHKAELQDKGSYRWTLYNVFGFDSGMYAAAMEAGYMDIHNALVRASEEE